MTQIQNYLDDETLSPKPAEFDMSIVMVTMNNRQYLEPCLESLYTAGLKSTFELVLVDNGSTDGTPDMMREQYPEVQLIVNDSNVGLSKACNQGIEATTGRTILLLNDDTLVNSESLDALVSFLDDHPVAGAVGGKLLNPDGSFQAGYARFSTLPEELVIATGLGGELTEGYPSHHDSSEVLPVDWITSACLLLRREALEQIGLLAEDFFIYGDEVDLQYRLAQGGWRVYYLPDATTVHYGGRSMNRWRRRKMVYRGKMLFYQKNYGPWKTGALRLMLGVLSTLKMIPWGVAYAFPSLHDRAAKELASNRDVIKLCRQLQ